MQGTVRLGGEGYFEANYITRRRDSVLNESFPAIR